MIKPRELFHFKPSIQIQGDWRIGLTNLEVCNSIFNITEENNKFELYRDTSAKFGFLELKDAIEDILNISHITNKHLDDEILGPRIIDEFIKLSNEKKNSDGHMIMLLGYSASSFPDFESYSRLVIGLDEEDIQLILKEYNSHFITYELTPGIYTIQDISDAIQTFSGHEETIQLEHDDISMRTTIVLKFKNEKVKFALGTLRFDKQSFFHTLLGFSPYWDYKPNNSNHVLVPGFYPSHRIILILNTIDKIHLKCNVIDGSIIDEVRQPILYSFALDKPSGYKVFCEPETIFYKKINKSVLNTITFYLEDDNNKKLILIKKRWLLLYKWLKFEMTRLYVYLYE